jgi:hypothetical protein
MMMILVLQSCKLLLILNEMLVITGMIFFSYLTDFSYFPLERNCRKLLDTIKKQVINGSFKKGV